MQCNLLQIAILLSVLLLPQINSATFKLATVFAEFDEINNKFLISFDVFWLRLQGLKTFLG